MYNMKKSTTSIVHSCSCCNVLARQGCSNNILKNGNKVWYVLHNLVENMAEGILPDIDCDNMRTTIYAIITSIPCIECKLHSITWFNETLVHNKVKLDRREKWIYELWRHHDTINKKVQLLNPYYKLKSISWVEYKKQIDINRITCKYII